MQQRIFKQLFVLVLIASLLVPGLGMPARVLAQDEGSPDPAAPAAVDAAPDAATDPATGEAVDPAAICEEPLPEGSVPGSKEVWLKAVESTYISSGKAGTNFDGTGILRVGYSIPDGQFAVRPLLRFDLGSIPRGAHVYSAQLELQVKVSQPATDPTANMGIKVMTVDANHNWTQGNASWNNSSGIGGSPTATSSIPKQGTGKVNMLEPVKYWVNGSPNHGIMIIGDERPDQGRVRTMDKWPALIVVYRCDTVPPVSGMSALGAVSPRKFMVGWNGEDKAPENCKASGLNKFYVEYNVDNQGWQPFTEQSGGTKSHEFNRDVPNGATVQFRIHADDKAGNMQKTPSQAQVTTRVITRAPTVVFNSLPEWTHANSFVVSWYATDALIGASSYDVQFQEGINGNWQELVTQTQQTSFTVTGAKNETVYGFRARARDSAGNEGTYPRQAQAQTTVVLYPVATVAAFNPNIIQSNAPVTTTFTVHWSGKTTPDTDIIEFHLRYQIVDFAGRTIQSWKDWGTFGAGVKSAPFPTDAGDGFYQFEATATNNLNQTTPYKGLAESSMIVDLGDTFKTTTSLALIAAP